MSATYELRHTVNGMNIDIEHVGAGKGSGAIVRVPVRSGLEMQAVNTAMQVLAALNTEAAKTREPA